MSPPVTPLDRRVGSLPVPGMIVGIAPVIIVFVSLAAGHTQLRGENLSTALASLYVVPMIVLGAAAALAFGSRLLPAWTLVAFPVAVIGCAALLQLTEALAPLTLAVGIAMLVQVARAPRAPRAPEVVARGSSPGVPAGAAPEQRMLRPATGAPPVRLRVLTPGLSALMIGVAVGSLAVGALMGYAAFLEELEIEGGPAARWIAVAIGVAAVLFGLFLLTAVYRARRDTIEIDGSGIRRHGGMIRWSLTWPEVRAIGVGLRVRVVPDNLTPTPRRLRERRTVQLLLLPVVPDFGGREELGPLRADGLPAPFTHAQPLPDTTPWGPRARLADLLEEALRAQVPDRYLVLTDGT